MPKATGRAAALLTALAAGAGGTTSSGPIPAQTPVYGKSTARVCALHDFGTPRPDIPSLVEEPYWFPEIGGVVEGSDGAL